MKTCRNRSGQVVPVLDFMTVSQVIGHLERNELFYLLGSEGSLFSINFMNPQGKWVNGFLSNPPDGTVTVI